MAEAEALAGLMDQWSSQLLAPAQQVVSNDRLAIARAALAIASHLDPQGRLMCFGAGHSWCLAAELCSRAGGLPGVVAMSLADLGPKRDQWRQLADSGPERQVELAQPMIDHHRLTSRDVLLVISNSGRNSMVIELARLARAMGCLVVCVVSLAHANSIKSRHPSGQMLMDHADIVLDNHGSPGDAGVEVAPGVVSGATSTIAGSLTLQLLACCLAYHFSQSESGFATIRSANLDCEASQ
ncbi:MAG: sugar isomerase domain-containing protein [Micrococcales bacterium]|nr:sugar isomerase domain-containing protein [Micrococcales bacterium]